MLILRHSGATAQLIRTSSVLATRTFLSGKANAAAQLPPRPVVREEDIEEAFLKGSGPGGQKINKTSSAVQLKHLPTGIVVKSQETRSRSQNRKLARRSLAEKIEAIEKGDQSRAALKADIQKKKKASKSKKSRRKYKALEDGDTANGEGKRETGPDLAEEPTEEERASRLF